MESVPGAPSRPARPTVTIGVPVGTSIDVVKTGEAALAAPPVL